MKIMLRSALARVAGTMHEIVGRGLDEPIVDDAPCTESMAAPNSPARSAKSAPSSLPRSGPTIDRAIVRQAADAWEARLQQAVARVEDCAPALAEAAGRSEAEAAALWEKICAGFIAETKAAEQAFIDTVNAAVKTTGMP